MSKACVYLLRKISNNLDIFLVCLFFHQNFLLSVFQFLRNKTSQLASSFAPFFNSLLSISFSTKFEISRSQFTKQINDLYNPFFCPFATNKTNTKMYLPQAGNTWISSSKYLSNAFLSFYFTHSSLSIYMRSQVEAISNTYLYFFKLKKLIAPE